jgi:predicted DCC family thiol-disulfide oxidoreductase YuxK
MKNAPPWPRIIIFDGICLLCNRTVDFLIRIDRRERFRFITLQNLLEKEWIPEEPAGKITGESVMLLDNGRIYIRSAAILKIAEILGFPWCLLASLYVIPVKLRDRLYNVVAANRYKWFGKRQDCRIPDEKARGRLIE